MRIKTIITVVFRALALVLTLAILLPSVVKLGHAFTHHTHHVCDNDISLITHFHETDFDCNFYKFKLTKQYYFNSEPLQFVSIESNFKITNSQYEFVSNFQKLQIALRGPPQMI